MRQLTSRLISYFAHNGVMFPEVKSSDSAIERKQGRTWQLELPTEPACAFTMHVYSIQHASLVGKEAALCRVQVLARDTYRDAPIDFLSRLYHYLLTLYVDDDFISYLDKEQTYYALFDVKQGPKEIAIDKQGRYIWGLVFTVMTNLF